MESRIDLLVGLGNPGPAYEHTRHNAGFWFLDALARKLGGQFRSQPKFQGDVCKVMLTGREVWLLKPATFMNLSGQAIAALAGYYKIPAEHILVAHDELDLPPGMARLKQGGGDGGHNGLRSTIASMHSADFLRLRIGIGHPGSRDLVTDYVLSKPPQDDRRLMEAAMEQALDVMPLLADGELNRAIHKLHSLKPESKE